MTRFTLMLATVMWLLVCVFYMVIGDTVMVGIASANMAIFGAWSELRTKQQEARQ